MKNRGQAQSQLYRLSHDRRLTDIWKSRLYVSLKDMLFPDARELTIEQDLGRAIQPRCRNVNGRFVSPWASKTEKQAVDILKYLWTKKQSRMTLPSVSDTSKLIQPLRPNRTKFRNTSQPHCTWIGHSTCYYQTNGVYFLTDPLWSSRASPFSFLGPKRFVDPPLEIEDLKIDVVLLSHTHYDHLDYSSAKRIGNKALWIVPLGVKALLAADLKITNCIELDWWQSHHYLSTTGETIEVIFTPTKHWTARGFTDRNTCLWGSFAVLSSQSKFFFTGDTAYCSVFKQIGSMFGPFDLAAIPLGAYAPRWFMKDNHCDPDEAVTIHRDLQAKQSFGIHWGTFPMADEDFLEPALELARVREIAKMSVSEFYTMKHGETLFVGEEPQHDFAACHGAIFGVYLDHLRNLIMNNSSSIGSSSGEKQSFLQMFMKG